MVEKGECLYGSVPDLANAAEHLPSDMLLEGEIVALDKDGRTSFNLLQRRRCAAQAILFYAFDVIMHRPKAWLKYRLRIDEKFSAES